MTMPDLPPGATGVITVDLDVIAANWHAITALVTPAECGAVVKADAYGLGALKVIPALARAGCRTFFVATPDEAEAARRLAPDARLFALDGLLPGSAGVFAANDVAPVLTSLEEIAVWSAEAARAQKRLPAGLQIDSGLNRLGLSDADVHTLASEPTRLDCIDLRLVMSHLACADDPTHEHNEIQRSNFDRLRALLPPTPASLAASDGLMLGARFHYDLVRPGYALYGGQAFQGGPTPVRPAVTVEARVLQVRSLAPGDPVGYSATWRAARPTRLAVISAGYADGFARALSAGAGEERGVVAIHGQRAPIVGRVSMDLVTADVTDVTADVAPGDLATLVGPGLTIEAMGHAAGTIGYEVLTRLGPRFVRRYLGGAG